MATFAEWLEAESTRRLATERAIVEAREAYSRKCEMLATGALRWHTPYATLEAEPYTTAYTGGRLGGVWHGYRLATVSPATRFAWNDLAGCSYSFRRYVTRLALEAEQAGFAPPYGLRLRSEYQRLHPHRLSILEDATESLVDWRALAELLLSRPIVAQPREALLSGHCGAL